MPDRGKNRGKDDYLPRKQLRFGAFYHGSCVHAHERAGTSLRTRPCAHLTSTQDDAARFDQLADYTVGERFGVDLASRRDAQTHHFIHEGYCDIRSVVDLV